MKKNRTSSFVESTFVLVISSVLVKGIGAIFRIPLQNAIGGEGMGIFTVAYYIYSAFFTISTAGLPVAVSKMVAEANALGRQKEVSRIASVALRTFFVVGLAAALVMFFGADLFTELVGNSLAYKAVLAVAPSLFFVSIASAVRGYYQGLSNMVPTAFSQVIEALGKLFVGLGLAALLISRGYPIETAAAAAIGGVTIGTVLSAVYLVVVRLRDKSAVKLSRYSEECRSPRAILKSLISIAIPITIGASVLSLTNLIDMGVVMNRLQDTGMTEEAANLLYGIYNSASSLFNMPQTFAVAIAASIVPAISAALAKGNRPGAVRTTESAIRITSLIVLPCAFGLAVLSLPIMNLLYYARLDENLIGAPLLTLLGPGIILVALVAVTTAILQAMGRESVPVRNMLIGGIIKLIANYIMIAIPALNISGAPIATSLCYGTIAVLNLVSITRAGIKVSPSRVFLRPLIASAVMGAFAYFGFPLFERWMGSSIGVLAAIALSAVVYVILLLALRAIPKEDILMLPKGEKIVKILHLK